jgi:hypothetical protein
MKKITILLFSLFLLLNKAKSQVPSQNYIWAKSSSGIGLYGNINKVTTDVSGNIFVSGTYSSSSITFEAITLTNPGGFSYYLVKYDASVNVLWAKTANGLAYNSIQGMITNTDIAADANSNVYIVGSFSNSITIGASVLTTPSGTNVFLAIYDSNGNVLWARQNISNSTTNTPDTYGRAIATDAAGNVFITGPFSYNILFGTINLIGNNLNGNTFDVISQNTILMEM